MQIWLKMSFYKEWSRSIIIDPLLTIIQQPRIHQTSKKHSKKNVDQQCQSPSCCQPISPVKQVLTKLSLIKKQMTVYSSKQGLYLIPTRSLLLYTTVLLSWLSLKNFNSLLIRETKRMKNHLIYLKVLIAAVHLKLSNWSLKLWCKLEKWMNSLPKWIC